MTQDEYEFKVITEAVNRGCTVARECDGTWQILGPGIDFTTKNLMSVPLAKIMALPIKVCQLGEWWGNK